MRRGTPKEPHESLITVYSGGDSWKKRLGAQDEKEAYIMIDADG